CRSRSLTAMSSSCKRGLFASCADVSAMWGGMLLVWSIHAMPDLFDRELRAVLALPGSHRHDTADRHRGCRITLVRRTGASHRLAVDGPLNRPPCRLVPLKHFPNHSPVVSQRYRPPSRR